mmetsp:Transcript_4262/g.6358  ORF Transcript_4262/g.6358 Transcript_4262/m.6358 type:complete len:126 (-) Transcript_4262:1957-2334(-)
MKKSHSHAFVERNRRRYDHVEVEPLIRKMGSGSLVVEKYAIKFSLVAFTIVQSRVMQVIVLHVHELHAHIHKHVHASKASRSKPNIGGKSAQIRYGLVKRLVENDYHVDIYAAKNVTIVRVVPAQ